MTIHILSCFASVYAATIITSFPGVLWIYQQLTGLQVDSKDSLENVESKWVNEITENCPGVKLVLVALKCDLREAAAEEEDDGEGGHEGSGKKETIDYHQGLEVARRIGVRGDSSSAYREVILAFNEP